MCESKGRALADGGFESRRGEQPTGWQKGGGTVVAQSADVPAVEGTHYARTWHNQTLSTTLQRDRRPAVTIRVHARAVRVDGSPRYEADRRPIDGGSPRGPAIPAWRQPGQRPGSTARAKTGASTIRPMTCASCAPRGSTTSGSRSAGTTTPVRARTSESGPKSSRVPTNWSMPGCSEGLGVMINIHHFDDFTSDPKAQTARFLAIWRQVAKHYARWRRRAWPSSS